MSVPGLRRAAGVPPLAAGTAGAATGAGDGSGTGVRAGMGAGASAGRWASLCTGAAAGCAGIAATSSGTGGGSAVGAGSGASVWGVVGGSALPAGVATAGASAEGAVGGVTHASGCGGVCPDASGRWMGCCPAAGGGASRVSARVSPCAGRGFRLLAGCCHAPGTSSGAGSLSGTQTGTVDRIGIWKGSSRSAPASACGLFSGVATGCTGGAAEATFSTLSPVDEDVGTSGGFLLAEVRSFTFWAGRICPEA